MKFPNLFFILILLVFTIPFVSADLQIGTSGEIGIDLITEIKNWVIGNLNVLGDSIFEGTVVFKDNVTIITPASLVVNTSLTISDWLGNPDIVLNSTGDSWFNGDGNVGIGTASPDDMLHIAKTGTSSYSPIIMESGNHKWELRLINSADDLAIIDRTNGGTQPLLIEAGAGSGTLVLDSNERVGIGTATPQQNLHIHNAGTGGADHSYLQFTTGDTGATSSDGFTIGYRADDAVTINNRENTNMEFETNDIVRMTITAGGNVGIGVSPSAKLDVFNPNTNVNNPMFILGQESYGYLYYIPTNSYVDDTYMHDIHMAGNTGLKISVHDGTDALGILTNGNVGIGTMSPDSLLHINKSSGNALIVDGGTASGSDFVATIRANTHTNQLKLERYGTSAGTFTIGGSSNTWRMGTGGYAELLNLVNGKVGIGTVSPNAVLHINSTNTFTPSALSEWTDSRVAFRIIGRDGAGDSLGFNTIGSLSYGIQGVRDDGNAASTISLNPLGGNVGIGTAAPTHELNVVGDLNVTKNITGNFIRGQMWFDDVTSITNIISTQNVWINVTGFNSSEDKGQYLNGVGYNDVGEYLECLIDGNYEMKNDESYGNAGNNQEYEFAIGINSVPQNCTKSHRKIGSAGDVGDSGDSGCYINCVQGDRITLMARNKDNVANLLMHFGKVTIERKGD